MKEKWYWAFCVILVFVLVLLNCENSEITNTDPKTLVIEGIQAGFDPPDSSYTYLKCWITDKSELYTDIAVATGFAEISGGSATIELYGSTGVRWTGTGSYSITIDRCDSTGNVNGLPRHIYNNGDDLPYFTNSKSKQELNLGQIQTYSILDTVSRISVSKFKGDSSWGNLE
jgi:hypothetical protein